MEESQQNISEEEEEEFDGVYFRTFQAELDESSILQSALASFNRFGSGRPISGQPLRAACIMAAALCARLGAQQDEIEADAELLLSLREDEGEAQQQSDTYRMMSIQEFALLLRWGFDAHRDYVTWSRGGISSLEEDGEVEEDQGQAEAVSSSLHADLVRVASQRSVGSWDSEAW